MRPEIVKVRKGKGRKTNVAVLLVTHNGLAIIRKVLRLLCKQTLKHNVILVVNPSENPAGDKTFKAISREFPAVTIILARVNYGGAGGFFLAQEYAWHHGFEFFVMGDGDAYPMSKKMLEVLVAACKKRPNRVFMPTQSLLRKRLGLLFHYGTIHRSLIKKAGFVDYDYFFRSDDFAYSLSLQKAGASFVVLSTVAYQHHLTGVLRSTLPIYFMVRNELRAKLEQGFVTFVTSFLQRTSSFFIARLFFFDKNLAYAYAKGLFDFVLAQYTLERSLRIAKHWKEHAFTHHFTKTIRFSRAHLQKHENDVLMTDAIHNFIFGEDARRKTWRFFFPRRELITITYGSGSILPSLFAQQTYFLNAVDYRKKEFSFFLERNRAPYALRLLFALLIFALSVLFLPFALLTHFIARFVKRNSYASRHLIPQE